MKVAELEGNALDEAVMRGLLDPMIGAPINEDTGQKIYVLVDELMQGKPQFHPSRDWAQGGPIIEHERISVKQCEDGSCYAYFDHKEGSAAGASPLVASMRLFVLSKLGNEVPDAGI